MNDRCACGKTPCGMIEIHVGLVRRYREAGAVVQLGLGDVLPGYWVHECWRTLLRVEKHLQHGREGHGAQAI